jgi:hypothetical protein
VYTKTAADGVATVMRIVFRGEKAMEHEDDGMTINYRVS